jgi:hypothetical protein
LQGLAIALGTIPLAVACRGTAESPTAQKSAKKKPVHVPETAPPKASQLPNPPPGQAPPAQFESEIEEIDLGGLRDALRDHVIHVEQLPRASLERQLTFETDPLDCAFSPFHADTLVRQADELLDRCLRDRAEWEDKFLKAHQFMTDLDQFDRLDAIHKKEEAQGFYEVDAKLSSADLTAAQTLHGWLEAAQYDLRATADRVRASYSNQYSAALKVGWLSHISGYQKGLADNTVKWNDVEGKVIDLCYEAAGAQVEYQLLNELNRADADVASRNGEITGLAQRLVGLATKANWEGQNRSFRRLRTEVLRQVYAMRRRLVTESGGALNFGERLQAVQRRCARDFRDAVARIAAARTGLRVLFGYDAPLPASVEFVLSHPGTPMPTASALDDAVQWTRDTAAWLIRFSERDQMYSPTVSLRDLLGEAAWKAFIRTGTANVPCRASALPQASVRTFAGHRFAHRRHPWLYAGKPKSADQCNYDRDEWPGLRISIRRRLETFESELLGRTTAHERQRSSG